VDAHGRHLDGVIRDRRAVLRGILNGVDYDEWKTTGNPWLPFVDATYGSAGVSGDVVDPAANGSNCTAIGAQRDGRVIVGGSRNGDSVQAFAARLLSTGAADPLFRTGPATGALSDVTALAIGADDSIALAGHDKSGVPGALVVRLQADGLLDLVFGRNGSTTLDLESDQSLWPAVYDMQVLPDGAIVMAGGGWAGWSSASRASPRSSRGARRCSST